MKTRITLLSISLVLILSSCSQRYGYIPKVRATPKSKVAQAPAKRKKLPELHAIGTKGAVDMPVAIATEIEIERNLPQQPVAYTTPASKAAKNGSVATDTKTTAQNAYVPVKKWGKAKRYISKAMQATEKDKAEHSWLWYFILGLIFILVAIIIAPGGVALVFYIAGLIAIFIGLMVLLGLF